MRLFDLRYMLVVALLSGTLAATGCYVQPAGYGTEVAVVGNYGYEPQYYDGYMVYYDGVGRPFYYAGGARIWIPATSPYYSTYLAHYRSYGQSYHRWYAGTGHRYHTYRATGGYYGGHRGYVQRYRAPVKARPVQHRR